MSLGSVYTDTVPTLLVYKLDQGQPKKSQDYPPFLSPLPYACPGISCCAMLVGLTHCQAFVVKVTSAYNIVTYQIT